MNKFVLFTRKWTSAGATLYLICLLLSANAESNTPPTIRDEDLFKQGCNAYLVGNYQAASDCFYKVLAQYPSTGAYHNLGNAEWKLGKTGLAILAWERAQWLDPFQKNTRANLRFARKSAQLDNPDLTWFEICSTWLPVHFWPWLASISFWLAIFLLFLPGALRWKRVDWHQGVAAAGITLFLLTTPALLGVFSRTKIGIILTAQTALRLTPTKEAQVLTRLQGGEMVRVEKKRGEYLYVRANNDNAGWISQDQFQYICSPNHTQFQ